MSLSLTTIAGKKQAVELPANIFENDFNQALVHQAVVTALSNVRAGTKAQKTRSEVRGGGAKPWRQKGTGRARAGSIRSPLWKGGGVVFAAKPRSHEKKLNKQMYRSAIRSIFSELVRQNRILLVEGITTDSPKTKAFIDMTKDFLNINETKNALIITDSISENLYLATRNLSNVSLYKVEELNPVCLVAAEKIIITLPALKQIEEWLG